MFIKVYLVLFLLYLCRAPDISASCLSIWRCRDCLQCQAFPEAAGGVNGCSQFHAVLLDQDSILLTPHNLSMHLHWNCLYVKMCAVNCFRHLSS